MTITASRKIEKHTLEKYRRLEHQPKVGNYWSNKARHLLTINKRCVMFANTNPYQLHRRSIIISDNRHP